MAGNPHLKIRGGYDRAAAQSSPSTVPSLKRPPFLVAGATLDQHFRPTEPIGW